MTEIKNEMICGTIDSSLEKVSLTGEMKVSKEGILMSIQSGMVYDVTNNAIEKKYLGSYSVTTDPMNPSAETRSISMNISDITKMGAVSNAIIACLKDIENKYKTTV